MSSRQKRAAARANGAKSQGPNTPAGIATSSMNAVRYGLFAKTVVLNNESQERFAQLGTMYCDKFQPTDHVEHDLVAEMVVAKWRQQRCWILETAVLDLAMDAQAPELATTLSKFDEPTRVAIAHQASMPQLASIHRAEASCRRQYDLAIKTLFLLRAAALPQAPIALQNEPTVTPETPPATSPAPLQNEPNQPVAPAAPRQHLEDDKREFSRRAIAGVTPHLRRLLGFEKPTGFQGGRIRSL